MLLVMVLLKQKEKRLKQNQRIKRWGKPFKSFNVNSEGTKIAAQR